MKEATLCLLMKDSEILLAMKKRGFGAGKYNGVGGKPQAGETILETAIRETKEEIGVTVAPENMNKVAELDFHFADNPDWDQKVHVYAVRNWEGSPEESEEMAPRWFKLPEIPYDLMWPDDSHWLPFVLAGKFINGRFDFVENGSRISDYTLREA